MAYKRFKKICVGCKNEYMGTPKTKFCSVQCSKYGVNSNRWKGDDVGIDALHTYIRRQLPKTDLCQCCEKVPPYDLANISDEYKRDVTDWEWLCRKCYMNKDGRIKNLKVGNKKNEQLNFTLI